MPYESGPAILILGGEQIYFKDGLTETIDRKTDPAVDDVFGTVAQHHKSTTYKLSGTPTALRRNLDLLFPYGKGSIGSTIFSESVVVHTKAGTTYTYGRGGITKSPTLNLSAGGDLFKDGLELTCIGKLGEVQTTAGHFRALATTAFPDSDFDHSKIKRYRYTAAWGGSPFATMTAQAGFEFATKYKIEEIPDDNFGIGDIVLSDIECECKFIPSNLTAAQISTLLKTDGSGILQPGGIIGADGEDVVITGGGTGDGFSVTMRNAGAVSGSSAFKTGKLRAGEVMFMSRTAFTDGVPDAIFTLAEL